MVKKYALVSVTVHSLDCACQYCVFVSVGIVSMCLRLLYVCSFQHKQRKRPSLEDACRLHGHFSKQKKRLSFGNVCRLSGHFRTNKRQAVRNMSCQNVRLPHKMRVCCRAQLRVSACGLAC